MVEPILLRPWTRSDAEALRALYRTTHDLGTELPVADTITAAIETIEGILVCTPVERQLAITVDGLPVGNVGIGRIDRRHDTGWVSYFSSSAVRGRGYVTRAVTAACSWALTEVELFRLELGHRVNNPASGAVARAAGFRYESRQRSRLRYGDTRFDVLGYSRLADDPFPPVHGVVIDPAADRIE